MQRRAPGKSPLATARNEKDAFIIESGFLKAEQQVRRYVFNTQQRPAQRRLQQT